ncbi:MAG: BadF/BadG/BcrA/BcrD ATPase family protein [Thermoleophilia bacterium]
MLALGVDGGNTKTIALAASLDGAVVGAGRGGCADIYGTSSFDAAVAEIKAAVRAALPEGVSPADVGTAVFSLAGADWDEDKAALHEAVSLLVPCAEVTVVNDAIGALRAGADDGVGVAVVCGTGGCVGSRGRDGREWHSSWWGLHTGAWAMGNDALRAVYDAELGIKPATALTAVALEIFGEPSVEELLHTFTRRGGRHAWDAALLTPSLLHHALTGDGPAEAIVREHGEMLGSVAWVAANRVGLEPPYPLILLGGVMRGEGAGLLIEAIVRHLPGSEPVRPRREPAVGALLMALDRSGTVYDPAVVDRTTPGHALFGTLSGA